LLFVAAALGIGYLLRVPILQRLPAILIVDESAPAAPSVLFLEGTAHCAAVADAYQHRPTYQIVWIVAHPARRVQRLGLAPTDEEIGRPKLAAYRLPDHVLTVLHCEGTTEWDQARSLDAWLRQHPDAQGILFCTQFHSRRKRLILDRVLAGTEAERVRIRAVPDPTYQSGNWWQRKPGLLTMFHESVGLGYSFLHGPDAPRNPPWDPDEYERTLPREGW
jgi:hypothetical protein